MKTNAKQKLAFSILFSCGFFSAISQDYTFSQFYTLPLMRNPALGGVFTGDIRLQSVYRNQWQNITVPFRTSALSAELKMPSEAFTLGLQITHDIAGDSKLKRIQVLPSLSYHQYITEDIMLTAGFMGGMVSSQFDPSALKWDDQFVNGEYNPSNPTRQVLTNTSRNYLDFASGATITSSFGYEGRWYAGAAIYHINKPRIDFSYNSEFRLNQKFIFNVGLNTITSEFGQFSIYADLFLQGGHKQLLMGGYYTYDLVPYVEEERISLSFGGMYRWNDALIPVIKLDWYQWNVGMSYDVNVSKLKTASLWRGGFELTLGYRDFLNGRNRDMEKTRCFEPL